MTGSKTNSLLSAAVVSLLMAGCSSEPVVDQGVAPPPPHAEEQATAAPKVMPIDQLRALTSPEGMSYKPLFEEQLSDEDDRLSRLEEAVDALRIDMDMVVAPAVTKLIDDAKVAEVEEPVTDESAAAAPTPAKAETQAPAVTAEKPVVAAVPEKATVASNTVKAVRIGDHTDKTRIVLDITSKTKPSVSFAHENTQLVVDLGDVAWEAPAAFQAETAKMVASWQFKDGKFTADLLSPAVLKQQSVLDPAPGQKAYRIVLDIAAK